MRATTTKLLLDKNAGNIIFVECEDAGFWLRTALRNDFGCLKSEHMVERAIVLEVQQSLI